MDWAFTIQCIVGIIAITDPLGVVPVFLSACDERDRAEARSIARRTTLTVLITLVLFACLGQGILRFFGITLPAFRVGGGILIAVMALPMLHGRVSPAKQNPDEAAELSERETVAIVPLGIPLLAGPGAISTVMLFSQKAHSWPRIGGLAIAIGLTVLAVYVTLRTAARMQRFLNPTELAIAHRVMGLILIAMSVQFIADGLKELFPLLTWSAGQPLPL